MVTRTRGLRPKIRSLESATPASASGPTPDASHEPEADEQQTAFVPGTLSGIASLPVELLCAVFGYVVLFSETKHEKNKDSTRTHRLLASVCRGWKAVVSILPLPHVNTAGREQSGRLCRAFRAGEFAARSVKSVAFTMPVPLGRRPKPWAQAYDPIEEQFEELGGMSLWEDLGLTYAQWVSTHHLEITALWAEILQACPNVVKLAILFEPNRDGQLLEWTDVFTKEFLASPRLSTLIELRVSSIGSWSNPLRIELLGPVLVACSKLSRLTINGFWMESESWDFPPLYDLVSLDIEALSCSCDGICEWVTAILGTPTALRRLVVGGDQEPFSFDLFAVPVPDPEREHRLTLDQVRLSGTALGSIDTVSGPLPRGPRIRSALTRLKTCMLVERNPLTRDEYEDLGSSAVRTLRIDNDTAQDHDCTTDLLIPLLEGGYLPNIKNVVVEYIEERHGHTLDQLNDLQAACIAQDIAFELVEDIWDFGEDD